MKKFINISNHPSTGWSEEQKRDALHNRDWDVEEIVDFQFPHIDPSMEAEEINRMAADFLEMLDDGEGLLDPGNIFHMMGEMTFVFDLVRQLDRMGFPCVASTTERIVEMAASGEVKRSHFRFVRFRAYNPQRLRVPGKLLDL